MLIKVKELSDKEAKLLMEVYRESNKENIFCFFPEVQNAEQGLRMVEKSYIQWLCHEFFKKENAFCYVWKEKGVWISALRIHYIGSNLYYIEALETHPEYRKKGYAEKLINAIVDILKENEFFEIRSYTSIKNIASQKTHKKCGFTELEGRPFDYITQEYVDNAVAFSYKYINNTQKL